MRVITLHMPKGGAGRTFVALMLASAFAAQGARVLVVEGLRRDGLPFWRGWFDAQDPADPLAPRLRLACAETGRAVHQIVRRARREGFDLALLDSPRAASTRPEPLIEAVLVEGELILLPHRNGWEARLAYEELERLGTERAAAVVTDAPEADLPALRALWEEAAPDRLLRAALPPVPHHTPRLHAWPHATHARLLAREAACGPKPAAGPEERTTADLTARLAPAEPDLAQLEALGAVVRAANALAAEALLRGRGAPAPRGAPRGAALARAGGGRPAPRASPRAARALAP